MAIKKVVLKSMPVVKNHDLPEGEYVSNGQLAGLERNIRTKLSQNEARRAAGIAAAGQYMAR